MGDSLCVGKPSRCITGHLGEVVNSAFYPSGIGKSSTGLWLGLRRGVFICVGWQVKLCDSIWQVTPRSSGTEFHKSSTLLNLTYNDTGWTITAP